MTVYNLSIDMRFVDSGVFFLLALSLAESHIIFGEFIHCELEKCSKYDHILVGRKVDRCTQDLLIKYKKNESYIMAFLNENGIISDQSFIKNCTSEMEVKVYQNFVAYRKGDSILVYVTESTTTASNIYDERMPISSPLNVNDLKKIENGVTKVLNKFNIDRTDTVELIILSVVSFLVLIYIMIFTVNKRKGIAKFLNALSRHISQRDTHSTPDVSNIEENLEIFVESDSRTTSNEEVFETVGTYENTRSQVQSTLEPQRNGPADLNNGERTIVNENNPVQRNVELDQLPRSQAQSILIETFNISRSNVGVNERIIISTCPFQNCKFTTTKGERGVKTHYRMMHKEA